MELWIFQATFTCSKSTLETPAQCANSVQIISRQQNGVIDFEQISLIVLVFPLLTLNRRSHSEVFLGKVVLKICSKFIGEHPCRSLISIKLLCNFIEITLWHKCSPVNLLHVFGIAFSKNTFGWLLMYHLISLFLNDFWKRDPDVKVARIRKLSEPHK